jgi:hypothetical protein
MPLPMVHLFIAETMFKQRDLPLNADFLLGSIAPDAIHMRDNWTRDDKRRTHFNLAEDTELEQLFENKLRPFFEPFCSDDAATCQSKGYIAHVLTDFLWNQSVYGSFRRLVEQEKIENERALYYTETDQIDFNFFHNEPWRLHTWQLLTQSSAVDIPELLTASEIDKWKVRTINWFKESSNEPCIKPIYITEEAVRAFIHDSAVQLLNLFERAGYM